MRQYGRVLLAGGAAAIYYTAYAAHYVDGLRVIQSPVLGGGLLLMLAGGFIWWADRRRSEAIATVVGFFWLMLTLSGLVGRGSGGYLGRGAPAAEWS